MISSPGKCMICSPCPEVLKDGQMRSEDRDKDSDLLIRLSKATSLLQRCSSEELEDALRDLQMEPRISADCDEAEVSASIVVHGYSSHLDFLVLLLKSDSKMVTYAASKTLFALSNFLRKFRRAAWASFLLHLWTLTCHWVSGYSSSYSECFQAKVLHERPSGRATKRKYSKEWLGKRDRLLIEVDPLVCLFGENNLLAASYVLQLLQKILKGCVKSSDGDLQDLRTFLELLTESITDIVTASCPKQNPSSCNSGCLVNRQKCTTEAQMSSSWQDLESKKLRRELLLGSVLRLLCTATHFTSSDSKVTNAVDIGPAGPFLETMESLIPVLSSSALPLHIDCEGENFIPSFLCHKMLMIKIKLSECFEARPSLAFSCLKSLQSFGAHLLEFSLQASASEADSLDDSPFLASLVQDPQNSTPSSATAFMHLQRRALYLVFKIVSLIPYLSDPSNADRVRYTVVIPGTHEHDGSLTVISALKLFAIPILIDWLNRQSQPFTNVSGLTTNSACIQECSFVDHLAKSLVQFYLNEDDLMLKMLLQLLDQPSLLDTLMRAQEAHTSGRWKMAARALSPEHIFHAFLAGIQYSSSILVDFLISEDSGALCLSYLMRTIRYINVSWPLFLYSAACTNRDGWLTVPRHSLLVQQVNKSLVKQSVLQTVCSRRAGNINSLHTKSSKVQHQDQAELTSERRTTTLDLGERNHTVAGAWSKSDVNAHDGNLETWKPEGCCCESLNGNNICGRKSVVRKVATCLQQLKVSIARLNQRSLFPYNPSALLKRLEAIMEHLDEFMTAPEAYS